MSQYRDPDEARFSVAVDTVVFTLCDRDLKTLLVRRQHDPFAEFWALPGCFVRDDEALDDAALRLLSETLDTGGVYCQQLYTFGDPCP